MCDKHFCYHCITIIKNKNNGKLSPLKIMHVHCIKNPNSFSQVDSQSSCCIATHFGKLMGLWRSCSQQPRFGVPVHVCNLQFFASRFIMRVCVRGWGERAGTWCVEKESERGLLFCFARISGSNIWNLPQSGSPRGGASG